MKKWMAEFLRPDFPVITHEILPTPPSEEYVPVQMVSHDCGWPWGLGVDTLYNLISVKHHDDYNVAVYLAAETKEEL